MSKRFIGVAMVVMIALVAICYGLFYLLMSTPYDFYSEQAAPKGEARQVFEQSIKLTDEKNKAEGIIAKVKTSSNWAHFTIKSGSVTYDLYKWDNSGLDWAKTFGVGDKVRSTYNANSLGIIRHISN